MKKQLIRSIFLLTSLVIVVHVASAQNVSCAETLNNAQNRFNNGDFYSIPAILKPCLDKGFSDQQKVEAYWLLTQTYLFLDDPISAEDSYLKLLKLDPLYEVNEELDPIDVVYLSEKFTTRPRFVVGAQVGANTTLVDVIHPYTLSQANGPADYSGRIGIQGGISLEYVLNDQFSIGSELNIMQRRYHYKKDIFTVDNQEFLESQTMIDLPLIARYRFRMSNLAPYIYAGFSGQYLIGATGQATLFDRFQTFQEGIDNGFSEFKVEGPELDLMNQRNRFTYSFVAGAGVLFPVKINFIRVDFRMVQGMKNVVNENNHYSNNELIFRYAYIDDYKRLNNFMLSVGFVKPIYKPRKVKSRR